jgi:hypothetical protein
MKQIPIFLFPVYKIGECGLQDRGSIPGTCSDFILSPPSPRSSSAHTTVCPKGVWEYFCGNVEKN